MDLGGMEENMDGYTLVIVNTDLHMNAELPSEAVSDLASNHKNTYRTDVSRVLGVNG